MGLFCARGRGFSVGVSGPVFSVWGPAGAEAGPGVPPGPRNRTLSRAADRKSTRLNSSHVKISYAVFCLKKKKNLIAVMTATVVADRQGSASHNNIVPH